jgi:hypothetical protein
MAGNGNQLAAHTHTHTHIHAHTHRTFYIKTKTKPHETFRTTAPSTKRKAAHQRNVNNTITAVILEQDTRKYLFRKKNTNLANCYIIHIQYPHFTFIKQNNYSTIY